MKADPRNPFAQFRVWGLGVGVGLALLIIAQMLLFWFNHAGIFGGLSANFEKRLLIFVTILVVSAVGFSLLVLRHFFQTFVFPLRRLEEDVEALVVGSPEARVDTRNSEQLTAMGHALNRLMERYESSGQALASRVASASHLLALEKQSLESVLDALSEGVIVCDPNGAVRRYNRAAKRLLDASNGLGLGRSVYDVVEKTLCAYALGTIGEQITTGVAYPFAQFRVESASAGPLQVRVAPLIEGDAPMSGFVLTLEAPATSMELSGAMPVVDPSAASLLDLDGSPLEELRFVVFDTETTGMDPSGGDEIVSIAGIAVVQGRILEGEVFERLVNPGMSVSAASIRVHGLTDADLVDKPTLAEILPAFAEFTEEAVLVAHNAAFDMRFLSKKEAATGIVLRRPVLDTLLLSAVLHPTQTSHSLDTLLERYGIRSSGRHTALGDARMTAELFLKLLPQLDARGINTLGQALHASQQTPLARLRY